MHTHPDRPPTETLTHATQVVSHDDGNVYALRRFDGARTTPKIVAAAVDTWRRIQVSALDACLTLCVGLG